MVREIQEVFVRDFVKESLKEEAYSLKGTQMLNKQILGNQQREGQFN